MTSTLLEVVENWDHPFIAGVFLIFITFLVFSKITRLKFLLFLIVSSLYFLSFRFPEVPNHMNLILVCNLVLIGGLIYSLINRSSYPNNEDYFNLILPFLRITMIPVYFIAGFHKLNSDFFNPEVSCVTLLFKHLKILDLEAMLRSDIMGIPTIFVLTAGLGFAVWKMADPGWYAFIKSNISRILFLVSAALILAIISVLIFASHNFSGGDLKLLIIMGTMVFVIVWEMVGGLALAFPKSQAHMLLVAWIMHSVFALINFVDFSSLAFALLITFIPISYYEILNENAQSSFLNYRIHRARLYYILNVTGGIFAGIHYLTYVELNIDIIRGIFFNAASIAFLFPILSAVFSPGRRPSWSGVSVITGRTPKLVYVYLAFLILFGMSPYFGLRTTGNYSMFSNLRTEGEFSNHLLLGGNQLKMWDYQEDTVYFLEIDDRLSEIGHKYRPLKKNFLPLVEFRKLIYQWKQDGREIPIKFKHGGKVYETQDIASDPIWGVDKRDWEMLLLDFRIVQPEGANECRW